MAIAKRFFRYSLIFVLVLVLLAGSGLLWLRSSPYWAGVTLFSEGHRVENFRSMDQIFPYQVISAGTSNWDLAQDARPIPETYVFEGQTKDIATFLGDTSTTGLIVLQDGTITFEDYYLGANAGSAFTSWSMAKSVLSALVGIAINEGHIQSIDDRLDRYVPALIGSGYEGVTIKQALTMSSGVGFDENYDNLMSDVNQLFFSLAAGTPMEKTLARLERGRAPGTYNDYISSDTIALGLMLEAATGMPTDKYLESRIWQPMGAEADAFWNTGRAGPVLPFCCLNATLRDYARLGRLFLEGGARDGYQIIPVDWVTASTRPGAAHLQPGENPASSWTLGYGYHWWIPENPENEFLAIGIWGQYIYVDQVRKVVIVKTSADYDFDTRDHESIAVFRSIAGSLQEPTL